MFSYDREVCQHLQDTEHSRAEYQKLSNKLKNMEINQVADDSYADGIYSEDEDQLDEDRSDDDSYHSAKPEDQTDQSLWCDQCRNTNHMANECWMGLCHQCGTAGHRA